MHILADAPTFTFAPAFSVCILFPAILLALILSAFLYKEQRRMAPLGTVILLTLLRLFLILLLAVLFLQPALQWKSSRSVSGTLWVVVDQSPSMQTIDPQATLREHLHWADGMGLISRKDRPDDFAARIHALTDELDSLTPQTIGTDERQTVRLYADRIAAWNKDLQKLISQVQAAETTLNNFSHDSGSQSLFYLRSAHDRVASELSNIRSAPTLRSANAQLSPFDVGRSLTNAQTTLLPAIAAADDRYLSENKSNSDWIKANDLLNSTTRDDLAHDFLAGPDARATKQLQDLAREYHMRVASFSDKAQAGGLVDAGSISDTLRSSLTPSGQATNMAGALQYVAEQITADEAASVIIISDGRNNQGPDPGGPARNLAARGVHVYGLLTGSHELSPDAAVEPVDFPDWIYEGDTIKPRAMIRLDGLPGKTADVQLRRGDQVIDHRQLKTDKPHDMIPFDFTDKPPDSQKVVEYEIRVAQMPGEVNTQNNIATFRVAVKKDKLYALFIEDRPRWEFRYLAAYLSRRPGMKLQTILAQPALIDRVALPSPVRASPDNPRTEAQLLPTTLAEWERFDVIVLGDVGPDLLTPQMQQFIASAVRDKGSTLITIAGQRAMPAKYADSPLLEILPVTLSPQWTAPDLNRHITSGFHPVTAPTAGMSVMAQLAGDPASNSRAWSAMPDWYWHSPFTQAKPAATVVWSIGDDGPGAVGTIAEANRHALLSTMTIGLGHSLYLASDQSWRLRQVGGANLHDRFWGQVLNWAVGSDLPAGGKYVRFGANQPTY
ncbi:MAG TPA: hypothetical protein VGN88_05905 [Phycisphaerae bacterium]